MPFGRWKVGRRTVEGKYVVRLPRGAAATATPIRCRPRVRCTERTHPLGSAGDYSAGIAPNTGLAPREVVHACGNSGVGEVIDRPPDPITLFAQAAGYDDPESWFDAQIEGRVDAASRLAYRTIQSPVVKAMALGAGVQRTAQRLVGKEPEAAPSAAALSRRRRLRRRAG